MSCVRYRLSVGVACVIWSCGDLWGSPVWQRDDNLAASVKMNVLTGDVFSNLSKASAKIPITLRLIVIFKLS